MQREIASPRRILAYLVIVSAINAFWAGFHVAVTEDALGRYGQVVAGTLADRISTTGEQGTRTFGSGSPTVLILSEEGEFYDVLERLVATGSAEAWAVNYSYPCGAALPCRDRAFVSHQRWLQMQAGDPVKVRYVQGAIGRARFDDEPRWATAIARMAMGVALLAAAVLIWGTQDVSAGTASRSPAQPAYPAGIDNRRRYMA